MSDKIEEIRERWAEFESLDHQSQVWDAHLYMRRAHNDRATLLAEVERLREALKIAAGYVNGCYHAWHLTRDRAEAWRDLTKIREVLNDERAGELEAKP